MGLFYWPPAVPRDSSIAGFIAAFRTLGYDLCSDGSLERGRQKIALYGLPSMGGLISATHASRQLESGLWTSKMGPQHDISHLGPEHVCGPVYGHAIHYLSRVRTAHDPIA